MAGLKTELTKLEERLNHLVDEDYKEDFISKYFNHMIMLLIMLSVVVMALDTVEFIHRDYKYLIWVFETFAILVFIFEYVVRLLTAHIYYKDDPDVKTKTQAMWKYATSFYGIIDIITIAPFYWPSLRLLRFLRLFKVARYNKSLTVIKDVMLDKRSEIGVSCFVIIIVMVIASFLMYNVEHEAQPEQFPNVFACIWWAVVTLTTVGYGDVYPITVLGKLVGGLIAFLGIGLVALPTGIISAGFLERISKDKEAAKKAEGQPADGENKETVSADGKTDESVSAAQNECDGHQKLTDEQRLHIYNGARHFCPYCGGKID